VSREKDLDISECTDCTRVIRCASKWGDIGARAGVRAPMLPNPPIRARWALKGVA